MSRARLILRSLAANDERIIEWFRAKNAGRKPKGGIIEIDIDEKLAESIDLADFADKIETRIWNRLARLSWRPYEGAAAFVRKLGLKSQQEWRAYCAGERNDLSSKPRDIPAGPYGIYGEEFLEKGGFGAWLGTGIVAPQLRTYWTYEASKFVHSLGLKSRTEWEAYCRDGWNDLPPKPAAVPAAPFTYGRGVS